MKITLNGKVREVESGTALSDLLASWQLAEKLVLVELNGRPVQRADFPSTKLAESDQIEIVRMVGGG